MNFLCIEQKKQNPEGEMSLSDPYVLTHLDEVLGKKEGDSIKVKMLGHGVGEASIRKMASSEVILKLERLKEIHDSRNVTLAVGACRPLMAKRILEHGTTLGVKNFIFFKSYLSESSYLDSKVFKPGNIKKYTLKGLSQTEKYINLPEVLITKSLQEICLEPFEQKLFLHGPGENYLSPKTSMDKNLIVFIGGERGWHESELQYFKDKEITEVAISESILRVEFAMQAFMAQAEWVKNARF
tara:strand:- start:1702 stop:2424 length:723 start_codon:yes stop_codon:yes gene_type:complete